MQLMKIKVIEGGRNILIPDEDPRTRANVIAFGPTLGWCRSKVDSDSTGRVYGIHCQKIGQREYATPLRIQYHGNRQFRVYMTIVQKFERIVDRWFWVVIDCFPFMLAPELLAGPHQHKEVLGILKKLRAITAVGNMTFRRRKRVPRIKRGEGVSDVTEA